MALLAGTAWRSHCGLLGNRYLRELAQRYLTGFLPEAALALSFFWILLATVLLSWGYVIYATRIAAKWQLEEMYPL